MGSNPTLSANPYEPIENTSFPLKSKGSEAKVRHKDGTQTPSVSMPRHPFIYRRNSVFYFRQRIPTDLVKAGCYGQSKELKESLHTSDLHKANQLAKSVALRIDEGFRQKRRELDQTKFATTLRTDSPRRRLGDLSETERQDFLTRFFITQERHADARWEKDEDYRQELLRDVREDLGMLHGELDDPQCNWIATLKKVMASQGISTENADKSLLIELAKKLQRAQVESTTRTEQTLAGHPFQTFDPLFRDLNADSLLPEPLKNVKTIADLCADYSQHKLNLIKDGKVAESTRHKIRIRCQILTDFLGPQKQLRDLSPADGADLVLFLRTIPHSSNKRYKGLSLVDAAELESKLETKRLLHPGTIEDFYEALASIFSHAIELGWMKTNPLKGRLVKERVASPKQKPREILTADEMTAIFASEEFLRQRKGGPQTIAARFWVPLSCLLQGTRSNEVAGMLVADIQQVEDIAYLNLHETADHRLKTTYSERKIPIHKKLIEMGFLAYVEERRKEDPKGYLFTGLTRNANGSMADGVGKWWQRLVRKELGEPTSVETTGGRGLHSLRHSWVAAARAARMDESVRKRLGGWTNADAADGYGWASALPMLQKELDRIKFPGVTFPRAYRRIRRG